MNHTEHMIQHLKDYFQAEKSESLLFLAIGSLAILSSLFFIFGLREKLWSGMAIPLILIGLIQVIVGGTVFFRTNSQVKQLISQLQNSKAQYVQEELPRMAKVNKAFDLYKIIEIVLGLAGIALMIFLRDSRFWLGVGIGLFLQSSFMLVLDLFAESRADKYTEQIIRLGKTI